MVKSLEGDSDMIKNFRYNSSWEDFSRTVSKICYLIQQKKAEWLIGFLKDFDLYIEEDAAFKSLSRTELEIAYEEILYLLMGAITNSEIDTADLKRQLAENYGELSEKEIRDLITNIENKYELIKDSFNIAEMRNKYNYRKKSINSKLCQFEFNICIQDNENGTDESRYALVRMTSQNNLPELDSKRIDQLISEREKKEVTFLCDETDIDILIAQLEEVKQKIRKC